MRAENLTLTRNKKVILDSVSLTIEPRTTTVLIGPNGAGKSSLVRLLLGLETPDGGSVKIRAGLHIGYVPQELARDPVLPISALGFLKTARPKPDAARLALALAEAGLTLQAKTLLPQLSGGEWRRLLLARALLRDPELLILDEPDQNLDLEGRAAFYQFLAALKGKKHCALLLVSHSVSLVMASASQVLCINRHVCCRGSPAEVAKDPRYKALFELNTAVPEQLLPWPHDHDHSHEPELPPAP